MVHIRGTRDTVFGYCG